MDDENIVLYGDGKQIRDVNYIDDVVSALLLVAQSKNGWGEAYNLGGAPVSLLDFITKTIKIFGRGKFTLKPFPKDREQIEVGDYIASWKKMEKTYGWKPKVVLDEGIRRTIDYYKKYKKYYW